MGYQDYIAKSMIETEGEASKDEAQRLDMAERADVANTVGIANTIHGEAARLAQNIDLTNLYIGKKTGLLSDKQIQQRGRQMAATSGLDQLGDLRTPNAISDIASQVVLAGAGSGVLSLGMIGTKAVLRKLGAREASKLVKREGLLKPLLHEGADMVAQGITTTPMDLVNISANEEGKVKTDIAEDAGSFAKAFGANMLGDVMFTSAAIGGGKAIRRYRENKYMEKRFTDDHTSGVLSLDSDAIHSINQQTIPGVANMKLDEDGFADINNLGTSGKADVIENEIAELDRQKEKEIMQEIAAARHPLSAEEEKVIRNTYENKYNSIKDEIKRKHALGKTQQFTFDDIRSRDDLTGAWRDGDKFIIKTPALGTIEGTIRNGMMFTDMTKSSPSKFAKTKRYGDQPILTPLTETEANAVKTMQDIADGEKDVAQFSVLSSGQLDENGKFQTREESDFEHRYGTTAEHAAKGNRTIEKIEDAKVTPSEPLGSGKFVRSEPLPTAQVITAKSIGDKQKLPEGLRTLRDVVEQFEGTVSEGVRGKGMKSFTAEEWSKLSESDKEMFDMLFDKIERKDANGNIERVEYTGVKDSVGRALDSAYAIELAKLDPKKASDTSSFGRRVAKTAFELLGIKGGEATATGHMAEVASNHVAKMIEDYVTNPTNTTDPARRSYEVVDGKIQIVSDFPTEIKEAVAPLGSTPLERQYAIENITKYGVRSQKEGLRFTAKLTRNSINDKYGSRDEEITKAAKIQAQTPFIIEEKALKRVIEIAKKDNIDLLQFVDPEAANMTKSDKIKYLANMEPSMQRNILKAIEDLREEARSVSEIASLTKKSKEFSGKMFWDVEIDQTGRIRYVGTATPQNSKIARMVFRPERTKMELFDKAGNAIDSKYIEFAKRGIIAMFGEKVEFMSTKEVDDTFNRLKDTLLKRNKDGTYSRRYEPANKKYTEMAQAWDEKVIGYFALDDFAEIATAIENKTNTPVTNMAELDGKVNGLALVYASLGITDPRYGIGSRLEKSQDIYEEFASLLNESIGTKDGDLGYFSRSDVKTAATAVINLASDYAVAKAIGQTLLDKARKISDPKKRIDAFDKNFINFIKTQIQLLGLGDIPVKSAKTVEALNQLNEALRKSIDENGKLPENMPEAFESIKGIENITEYYEKIKNYINSADKEYPAGQILKAYTAFVKLGNNKELTDVDIDAITGLYASTKSAYVKDAVLKILPEDVVRYRELLHETQNVVMTAFAYKYSTQNINFESAKKIVEDFIRASVKKDPTTAIKTTMDGFPVKQRYSLKEIVEYLGTNGMINESIMSTPAMREIVPTIKNAFGEVPLVTMKGYAGYDALNKINFPAPSGIGVFQPVLTISNDAGIMARTLNYQMLNIYDAGLGGYSAIIDFARNANELVGSKTLYENPIFALQEAIDNATRNLSDTMRPTGSEKTFGIDWLSKQEALAKNGTIEGWEKNKNKWEKYDATDSKVESQTKKKMDGMRNEISARKKDLRNKDDLVFEQYSNGMDDVVVRASDIGSLESVKEHVAKVDRMATDIDWYSNVEKAKTPFMLFRDQDISTPTAAIEAPKVIFNEHLKSSEYVNGIVRLAIGEEPTLKSFINVVHEFSHHTFATEPERYADLLKFVGNLEARGAKMAKDGKPFDYINPKKTTNDERLAQLVHSLYTNELIMANKEHFAALFNETDLRDILESNAIEIEGQKIYTLKDLEKAMPADAADLKTLLKDFKVNLNGALNSSSEIKLWLNGKKSKEFTPTVKGTLNKIKKGRVDIEKVNQKIGEIPVLELFAVDRKREALEKALSLKQGGENRLQAMTSDFAESIINRINEVKSKDFDRDLGNAIMMGVHLHRDILDAHTTSEGFYKAVVEKVLEHRERIKETAMDEGWFDKFEQFEKTIEKYVNGQLQGTPRSIVDKFLNKAFRTDPAKINAMRSVFLDYLEQQSSQLLMNKHKTSLGRFFKQLTVHGNAMEVVSDIFDIHKRFKNYEHLFGTNAELNLRNNERVGIAIPESEFKGSNSDVIARMSDKEGNRYVVVSKEKKSYIVGKQEHQIMEVDLNDAIKGKYMVHTKDGVEIRLTPQALNTTNRYVDQSASTMLRRNFYAKQAADIGADILLRQYELLKNEGVLLTESEYNELPYDKRDNFYQLHSSNPIVKNFGQHYVSRAYKHYLSGSKGFDIKKVSYDVFGPQFGKIVANAIKIVLGAIQMARGTILVYHASSYINSAISSTLTYMVHAANPLRAITDYNEARKLTKEYRSLIQQYAEAMRKGEDTTMIKAKIEKHQLHDLWNHGVSSTIRSDAYRTGSYQENAAFHVFNNLTGDKELSERLKFLAADPSTTWGKWIGEVYDNTELIPKIALYLAKRREGLSSELASQTVLMAFPTYNNLNPLLNMIDQISPYTKFMANWPKMFFYAADQHIGRLAAIEGVAQFAPAVLWANADGVDEKDAQWYQKHGFIPLPMNLAWYTGSLNPYSLFPSKTFGDEGSISVVDPLFIYDAYLNGGIMPDLTPFKRIGQ